VRYVERNPVRAGLVKHSESYRWSSARARVREIDDGVLDEGLTIVDEVARAEGSWSAWLRQGDDDDQVKALRDNTRTGRPSGTLEFVTKMEKMLGRRLTKRSPGRPRKERT